MQCIDLLGVWLFIVLCFGACHLAQAADPPAVDAGTRLMGSYRFERDGWIYVHLEGSPEQIGYQHGSLLADEIADLLRVIKPYLEKIDQARLELLPRGIREDALARHRSRISARDRRHRGGAAAKGVEGRPMGPGRAQRQPRAAVLLRPLARQEGREEAGHARTGQLQRLRRHGKLHQGRPDRHGPQRVDQLRRRHALEHRLRHQARRRARASSWTACRA